MENESTEMQRGTEELMAKLTARLAAAIELLERAIPRAAIAAEGDAVGPIVAMVEGSREAELARRLAEAEKTIAELRAQSSVPPAPGRRTLPVSLVAKQDGAAPEPAALDAALSSLSLEQRIAVKAQLLRAGLV